MAYKLTKLQAINNILSNVGQAPVANIDAVNPGVQLAQGMLDEVTYALQSEGWSFNTEQDYKVSPNTDGHIIIPSNVLSFDLVPWADIDVDQRGGKLYDKTNHTFIFTGDLYLKVVWYFDFEDLPEVFKQYATVRAANLFAGRAFGSAEAVRYSAREEEMARAACMEYETQQGDYNIFSDQAGYTTRLSFRPYDAIIRR